MEFSERFGADVSALKTGINEQMSLTMDSSKQKQS